jgi:hypothetical protein
MFIVSAARYKGEGGGQFESHLCQWIQPLNVNSANRGEPMPEFAEFRMTMNVCGIYNSPIRIN